MRFNRSDFGDVSHINDYFGVWAVHEETFRAAVARVNAMDIRAHVEHQKSEQDQDDHEDHPGARAEFGETLRTVEGGIAIIDLTGPLMKQESSLSGGTSTVRVRRKVRAAAGSDDIRGILLRIDSPGGTVAGTADLADDIAAAAGRKPVHAFIEDLGASAAYWIAAQADRISVTRTSLIGSIGTFAVIVDSSKAHKDAGFVVHVIRAGEYKGVGVDGTKVEDKHLAEMQRIIDGLNNHFIDAVAAGRSLTVNRVRELADGRVHVGQDAVTEQLADSVGSIDDAIESLRSDMDGTGSRPRARRTGPRQESNMSSTVVETKTQETGKAAPAASTSSVAAQPEQAKPEKAAGYQELKSACIGADADFLCKQMDAKATAQEAVAAWMQEQQSRITAANDQLEKHKSEKARAAPKTAGGYGPSPGSASGAGDVQSQWNEAVAQQMKKGLSKQKAVIHVNRENPQLRRDLVAAANPGIA